MRALYIFLMTLSLISCFRKAPVKTGLEGKSLPSFNLLLMDSNTKIETSNFKLDKPVVFFYFSPRCPYCKAEMNMIMENMDDFRQIQFCMVTNGFSFQETKEFYKHYNLDKYPSITVGYDSMYTVARYFKISGVPFTSIYGKDRKMKGAYIGLVKASDIIATANE